MDELFTFIRPTPEPVSSDFLLTQDDLDDMLTDEEAVDLLAAMYFPHIVWN